MTPLQRIAMGFVIVLVDAMFGASPTSAGWDGVPDPLGWGMVVWGLFAMRGLLSGSGLLWLAVANLAVSLATYPPAVVDALDESGGWALSLPQLGFCFMMCTALAPLAAELAGKLIGLRWVFVGLAVGPVLVFGGGVDALRNPLAIAIWAANLSFAYLLFRASGQVFPRTEPATG